MSQLFDPDTYKILVPYPCEYEIVNELEREVLSGDLPVPPNRIPDYKIWLKEQAKEKSKPGKKLYQKAKAECEAFFEKQMEEEWHMEEFPGDVKARIHYLASQTESPFCERKWEYEDFVGLARLCLAANKNGGTLGYD